MRALQLTEIGRLELRDIPEPQEVPAGWVVVRVLASSAGLFHTQMMQGVLDPRGLPRILGHEIVGEVTEAGSRGGGLVVVDPVVGCGACPWCIVGDENMCPDMRHLGIDLDGGFADYTLAPRGNVFRLPGGSPLGEAVMLSSAIPAATHAVRRAGIGPGARVAVIGIGSVGLAVCQIAVALGAAEVFAADVSRERLEVAEPWVSGSVHVEGMTPEESVGRLQELAGPPGIDVAFDTAGAKEGLETAIGVVRPGGTALLMGLIGGPVSIEFADYMTGFIRREITIRSTFGFTRTDFLVGNSLYAGGRLDLGPLAGETIDLEGVVDALTEIARAGTRGTRYVVRVGQPVDDDTSDQSGRHG